MILQRTEIDLIGPDEWPAEEGSESHWTAAEQEARVIYQRELAVFLLSVGRRLPQGFEVEAR